MTYQSSVGIDVDDARYWRLNDRSLLAIEEIRRTSDCRALGDKLSNQYLSFRGISS